MMTGEKGYVRSAREHETDVAIVGAGPTGLLLASELALRGVRAELFERSAERPDFARAFNLNARSLEILDRRGVVERFLAEGPRVPATHFAALDGPLDLSVLDTDHPYVLGIPQTRTEALLEAHGTELGARVHWGHEVVDVAQDDESVTLHVRVASDGGARRVRARYVVGCDGGRSFVRKRAGIAFPGTPATRFALLGDVELADPSTLSFGNHQTERGSVFVIPRPGYVRVITAERERPAERDTPVTLEELTDAVSWVLGREVELVRPRWLTRFGDAARQAERYRAGRILLAGDAAHVHPPAGSQGLNAGLQDAFNLGWKLAAVVRGRGDELLLDSYHDERHAAGVRLLMHTRAQTELGRRDERMMPVSALFREVTRSADARRALAELVSGLDARYVMSDSSTMARQPWLGRLAPNAEVVCAGERTSIAACLRRGDWLFIVREEREDLVETFLAPGREDATVAWFASRDAGGPTTRWLDGVDAALIRPDGHVAWMAMERHP